MHFLSVRRSSGSLFIVTGVDGMIGFISIIVSSTKFFFDIQVQFLWSSPVLHLSHSRLQIGHFLVLFVFFKFE